MVAESKLKVTINICVCQRKILVDRTSWVLDTEISISNCWESSLVRKPRESPEDGLINNSGLLFLEGFSIFLDFCCFLGKLHKGHLTHKKRQLVKEAR